MDGQCRKRAPITSVGPFVKVDDKHWRLPYDEENEIYWPMTSKKDWCGEFEFKGT